MGGGDASQTFAHLRQWESTSSLFPYSAPGLNFWISIFNNTSDSFLLLFLVPFSPDDVSQMRNFKAVGLHHSIFSITDILLTDQTVCWSDKISWSSFPDAVWMNPVVAAKSTSSAVHAGCHRYSAICNWPFAKPHPLRYCYYYVCQAFHLCTSSVYNNNSSMFNSCKS